jgi:hypothetical protein
MADNGMCVWARIPITEAAPREKETGILIARKKKKEINKRRIIMMPRGGSPGKE